MVLLQPGGQSAQRRLRADFSLRTLVGDASSGKGQVDVFSFRMSLAHYYMGHVLRERLEPSLQMWKKYWGVFESHTAHGANLTPIRRRAEQSTCLGGQDGRGHRTQGRLRLATPHSHPPLKSGGGHYDTVATKWKSVVDLRHAELEAALGAARADDGAAALARPNNGSGIDAAAADDTAREANGGGERVHQHRAREHQ